MGGIHIAKGGQLLIQNWKFQRGDIFFTRFDNATGSEQSGNRPAVVLVHKTSYVGRKCGYME